MKNLFKMAIPLMLSLGAFAGVSVDVLEKTFKITDENDKPVVGAVIEYSVSYDSCFKFYPGVGNPCSQDYFVDMELVSDANGEVVLPAVK